jgi:short-subunit dehydrogenase
MRLKKLEDQVIVITGASSGIGLATVRMAIRSGARVVVNARNEHALRQLAAEVRDSGGDAEYYAGDVADEADMHALAKAAENRFGGFDTWVNNAGVSIYGRLLDIAIEDQRRLFDTNFWGVVYGCRVAAGYLRRRGGAIINIGSVVSDRAIPIQGIYSASKHAVKGFTDALRMELEEEGAPVSVTLIKPTSIATPFTEHAKNYLPNKPSLPPPVYAPEIVAEAILHCAESPQRELVVGGGGKMVTWMGRYTPRVGDKYMERVTIRQQQQRDKPDTGYRPDGLYQGSGDLRERGDYPGHISESSAYTQAARHPLLSGALALGAGLAIAALLKGRTSESAPYPYSEPGEQPVSSSVSRD